MIAFLDTRGNELEYSNGRLKRELDQAQTVHDLYTGQAQAMVRVMYMHVYAAYYLILLCSIVIINIVFVLVFVGK